MAGKSDAFYEAYVSVIPTAKGFERSLNQQMTGQSALAGGVAGGAAGKGFVAGFGKAIPILGTILAAAGIGNIIGNAFEDGSTYQQAQGAVEQVFGALGAQAIQSFAEGGAKSVGQSMNDILGASSLLGVFGKAAGLADGDLVDFSKNLITLGADLAAFGNTTPQEAVEALSAGLRGESEPLRKYGVLLDDATLKARAMEMGIYDGNGPLTQQQRILAAYGEIMAQTTDQQGQFARESDTLAGKQAQVAAGFENISTRIGFALLPVAEQLIGVVEDLLIPVLEDFADWLSKPETQQAIQDFARWVGEFVEKLVIGAVQIRDFFDEVGRRLGIGAQQWGDFFTAVGKWFGEMSATVVDVAGRIVDFFNTVGERFALGGQQIGDFAGAVGRGIGEVFAWFGRLPGVVGDAVAGAGRWLVNTGRDLISGLVNGITGAADSVYRAIGGVVTGAIDWAKSLLGINSPSKVFAEIGEYTSQGFAQGIRADYGVVRSAAAGMTSAAADGVSLDGGSITGLLQIGGDGLGRIIDGRISYAQSASNRQIRGGVRTA